MARGRFVDLLQRPRWLQRLVGLFREPAGFPGNASDPESTAWALAGTSAVSPVGNRRVGMVVRGA